MTIDMHEAVLSNLMHPGNYYSDETIQLTLLLIGGIRNDVWIDGTEIGPTPESGIRIFTSGRDIDSAIGYYDIYVHDYYWEVFISAKISRTAGVRPKLNLSATRTAESWDMPFSWKEINAYLLHVEGERS